MRSRSINSDTVEDGDGAESDVVLANTLPEQRSEQQEALEGKMPFPVSSTLHRGTREAERGEIRGDGEKDEVGEGDRLFTHLRDNAEAIRAFCKDMVHQIPVPERCVIEGNFCVCPENATDTEKMICERGSGCEIPLTSER